MLEGKCVRKTLPQTFLSSVAKLSRVSTKMFPLNTGDGSLNERSITDKMDKESMSLL